MFYASLLSPPSWHLLHPTRIQNGYLDVLIYSSKAKQGYTGRRMEMDGYNNIDKCRHKIQEQK
jgi:hypothetical protein